MYKPLVIIGISLVMSACAGTTQGAQTAAQECKIVDNDETGSHISVKQECKAVGGQAAGAPQR